MKDGTKVSIQEMRLIAALFCDAEDDEPEIEFVDAQAMARKHPNTFPIPTDVELRRIVPNQFVKVCANNERFWVKVINRFDDWITGEVDHVATKEHGLKDGDVITVETRHIYEIQDQLGNQQKELTREIIQKVGTGTVTPEDLERWKEQLQLRGEA